MKKIIISIFTLTGVLLYSACSPNKPALFEQKTGIYFGAASDSLNYSFAKYPKRTTDTLKIPVNVLGDPAASEKTFTVEGTLPAAGTPAIEGVHYKLLNPYTMPAGKLTTTIPVVIYRTPGMDTTVFSFNVKLQPTEDFETAMTTKASYTINLAYLQKPAKWGALNEQVYWAGNVLNFGTWTKTKYKLILDALYDPVNDTTVTEFPFGYGTNAPTIAAQYLQLVKNYITINYPGNVGPSGAKLTDPDANNQVIQVGKANY
ncbi:MULTISPECIES: DUF4843 domain-containing protein [Niastella]|uniref:DUF4843 domain-containing protein n=1 Tax=Niastella soli TaxID=2821487 RepID=A0ABS3Z3T6_9BACT|nr:DUF4843 domain-containing protein [Niastella soli]MBO9204703.1 DUF4843 domain-containing protein [Niastella soli]